MYTFYQPPATPHLAASDSNVFEGKDELLKLGLCLLVPHRNVETVLGGGEKNHFARQRRPQQANALKTVPSIGKYCGEFYSKRGKNRILDKNQG